VTDPLSPDPTPPSPDPTRPSPDPTSEPATRPLPAVPEALPAVPERFEPGRARPVVPIESQPVSGYPVSGYPVTSPYPQSAYPLQPPYGGYAYPAGPATNGMAVASLVCSIVGLASCFLLCILGAIFGHMARKQVRERGESGDGLALAGIIIGWVGTGLVVLCCGGYLIFVVGFGLFGSTIPNQQ
jgi:hypothetical protein